MKAPEVATSPPINVNLPAGEHSQNPCPPDWKENTESLSLPQAEEIIPIKRRKRYFDYEESNINSRAQTGPKPCYICAQLHHSAKRCPKRKSCFFCKGKGHFVVDCPFNINEKDKICLKCGEIGHDMFSCNFDYCLDDLRVVPPIEDVECAVDLFQIPVEAIDSHLASCDQDVAVDSTSMNIGRSKEEVENCCYHELNGMVETVVSPLAEDLKPTKIDDEVEKHCKEELGFILQQQQAPNNDTSVLALVPPKEKSVITEHTILRRQRYFDSGNSLLEDYVFDSGAQRRCRPCYFCGKLEHEAKRCPKRRACHFCKGKGHFSSDCPLIVKETDRICLKCGQTGHDMLSCNIEYCPDDLSKIHCVACHKPGHIFCGSLSDINSQVVSCYKCGGIGHLGMQCPKSQLDMYGSQPPPMCYKCGEADHSARQCRNGGNVSGSYEARQSSALDLAAEGDDIDVRQNRKKARRQRAYKHGRLKKRKSRATECISV